MSILPPTSRWLQAPPELGHITAFQALSGVRGAIRECSELAFYIAAGGAPTAGDRALAANVGGYLEWVARELELQP